MTRLAARPSEDELCVLESIVRGEVPAHTGGALDLKCTPVRVQRMCHYGPSADACEAVSLRYRAAMRLSESSSQRAYEAAAHWLGEVARDGTREWTEKALAIDTVAACWDPEAGGLQAALPSLLSLAMEEDRNATGYPARAVSALFNVRAYARPEEVRSLLGHVVCVAQSISAKREARALLGIYECGPDQAGHKDALATISR